MGLQAAGPARPDGNCLGVSGVLRVLVAAAAALVLLTREGAAGGGAALSLVRASTFSSGGTSSAASGRLQDWRRGLAPLASSAGGALAGPQLFTLLAGSRDFGGAHSDISGGRPFVATADEVLSSHRCAGAPPEGGSCHFRNLYYTSSVVGLPDPFAAARNSGTWTYAVAVPAAEVAAGAWGEDALRALVLDIETEVRHGGITLSSRRPEGNHNLWSIGVVVLSSAPAPGAPFALPAAAAAAADADLGDAASPLLALVGDGEGGAVSCAQPSAALAQPVSAAGKGGRCVAPGVAGEVRQPLFFILRTNGGNLGHTLWDDLVPFLAAADDLGLISQLRRLAPLLTEVPGPWPRTWGSRRIERAVREMYSLLAPNHAELVALDGALGSQVACVREVAGGLTGMSTHNMRHDMRAYASDRRVVWRFRNSILRAAGFSEEEVERPAAGTSSGEAPPPRAFKLLFARSKRPVWNEGELLADIRRAFPELDVEAIAWEDLGGGAEGFRAEIARLARTHILLSGDGTVASTAPFLPRGAVHVQLGVPRPWGVQMQCEFHYASLDHVRVLYYGGPLEPGEHGATPFQGFAVPFAKLEPLLREAVALLREGFAVPAPGGANTPPSALMLSHLQHTHKDFYEFMAKGEKVNWEDWKNEGPYESYALQVYEKYVAASPADTERFAETIRAYCTKWACEP